MSTISDSIAPIQISDREVGRIARHITDQAEDLHTALRRVRIEAEEAIAAMESGNRIQTSINGDVMSNSAARVERASHALTMALTMATPFLTDEQIQAAHAKGVKNAQLW